MRAQRIDGGRRPKPGPGLGTARAVFAVVLALVLGAAVPGFSNAQMEVDAAYRIGAGDVLRIDVTGRADLSATVTVDDEGMTTLGSVGSLRAAGRTASELASDISRRISLTVREAPQVRVSVVEARGKRVFVLGSVLLPGAYSFKLDPTVWDAISEAGGPTDDADLTAVEIIAGDPSKRARVVVDVAAAIRTNAYSTLPHPKPGDTVRVPRSGTAAAAAGNVIYFIGAVSTQGAQPLLPPNDLMSTLTRSAPSGDADLSRIEIVRHTGGRVIQFRVNARDYLSQAEPNGNPELQAGDTIHVPRQARKFGLFSILGIVSPVIGLATSIVFLAR